MPITNMFVQVDHVCINLANVVSIFFEQAPMLRVHIFASGDTDAEHTILQAKQAVRFCEWWKRYADVYVIEEAP